LALGIGTVEVRGRWITVFDDPKAKPMRHHEDQISGFDVKTAHADRRRIVFPGEEGR